MIVPTTWTPGGAAQIVDDEFTQCPVQPVDIGLVIDRSGSMTGEPIDAAREGGKLLVENLTGVHQSGLTSYNHQATLDDPMSFDHASTITAIESLTAGGATATGDAIDVSHSDFLNNRRPNIRHTMIVLTDGFTNSGSDPVTQAQQAKADGIEIFSIGLGSNVNEQELREIATDDDHFYHPQDTDELIAVFEEILLDLVPVPKNRAHSTAVHSEVSVPANPVVDLVHTNATGDDEVEKDKLNETTLSAPIDGRVTVMNGSAATTSSTGERTATARQTIANVTLLDGQIRIRGLHAVAEAVTVSGETIVDASRSSFDDVIVQGNDLSQPVPPNTEIPLPGIGVLVLNEVTTTKQDEKAGEVLVNMVHLVVDNAQMRGEVIIGQAYAATSCDPAVGTLTETFDNDAGTGEDAGDTPGTATSVDDPTVFQGRMVDDGDDADHYAVEVEPGEKIQATVLPSTRAHVTSNGTVDGTTVDPGIPDMDLVLREPGTFAVREESRLPASAPDRVELNVDKAGEWVLGVERAANHGNYTLAITVTPIVLLDQNDALSGADAPDACRDAIDVDDGVHPGVLKDDDYRDFYKVSADIGDLLNGVLKPTEDADGANFDLFLYDSNCQLLQSSELGNNLLPKGTPDAVSLLPVLISQEYIFEVRRINGIGNYYLTTSVQDPQPSAGPLDAENGGDAGDSRSTATPVETPIVAQGEFPDGDDADWYSFEASAGQNITVTATPSAFSDADLRLVGPDGIQRASSTNPATVPESIVHSADTTGTWYLGIERVSGGGTYTFSIGATPQG